MLILALSAIPRWGIPLTGNPASVDSTSLKQWREFLA